MENDTVFPCKRGFCPPLMGSCALKFLVVLSIALGYLSLLSLISKVGFGCHLICSLSYSLLWTLSSLLMFSIVRIEVIRAIIPVIHLLCLFWVTILVSHRA